MTCTSFRLVAVFAVTLALSPALGCVQTTMVTSIVTRIGVYENTTCCGLFCWFTCESNTTRIIYEIGSVVSYKCCSGYGPSYPDCDPLCVNTNCSENMVCSAPETCTCATGWTGDNCNTDINECQDGTNKCEDNCINIPGTYLCTCDNADDILSRKGHRCLSPVTNIQSLPARRALTLMWTLPDNYNDDGNLTGFSITCNDNEISLHINVTNITNVSSLVPFMNYTCCILPQWSNENGPSACIKSMTLQDAPDDFPGNINVLPTDATSLLIQWEPPSIPNGIINYYILYLNFTNGSEIATRKSQFNEFHLKGLIPYQLVGVSISAVTDGGEGPKTNYIFQRTNETKPGQVGNLIVVVLLNTTVKITWNAPIKPNGIIVGYETAVISLTNDNRFTSERSVYQGEPLLVYITGLEPFVPYSVSVGAVTIIGEGAKLNKTFFTSETVPDTSPKIISAVRDTPTTILLVWSKLTLEESRGFITQYMLCLTESIHNCSIIGTAETIIKATADSNSYLFTGLEPAFNYCISVTAYTTVGKGEESRLLLVNTYESSAFVVYFSGIHNCTLWTQTDTQSKLDKINKSFFSLIALKCNCSITQDYIFNSHFEPCDGRQIVYKTFILGTVTVSSIQLVQIVKDWSREANSAVIVVNGIQLTIESVCGIREQGQRECVPGNETTDGSPVQSFHYTVIIAATVGSTGFILLLGSVVVLMAALACYVHKKKRKRKMNKKSYRKQNDEDSAELRTIRRHARLTRETTI